MTTIKSDGDKFALVELEDEKWAACINREQADAVPEGTRVFAPVGVADKEKGEVGFQAQAMSKKYASCAGLVRAATLGAEEVTVLNVEDGGERAALQTVANRFGIAIGIAATGGTFVPSPPKKKRSRTEKPKPLTPEPEDS